MQSSNINPLSLILFSLMVVSFLPKCQCNLPPFFTKDMNNIVISESTPVGTIIYKLEGADPEGSPLRYDLQGTDVLSVDHDSGAVTIVKSLDYETNATLNLVVSLEDEVKAGVKNNIVEQAVTVIVLDENDNPPEFQQDSYHIVVDEDTPVGTSILDKILVTDKDTVGENIEITCVNSLQSIDACDMFNIVEISSTVNSFEGAIVLKNQLNYTVQSEFKFFLKATDGTLESTAEVAVEVRDIQDTPPRFLNKLNAEIKEDAPINTLVLTVKAEDGDRGNPRKIVYELVNNPMDYFLIDPMSGYLYTARPLDKEAIRDSNGILKFQIRARELVNGLKNDDPLTISSAEATIKILDVNDEPPRFNKREYFIEIPENIPEGSYLPNLNMSVSDPDEGNNSAFSLQLEDISGVFSIEPENATGSTEVRIKVSHNNLDYEDPNQRKFIILVVAKELYTEKRLSSTSTITVSVLDVNDNAPTFDQHEYSAIVSEIASSGTLVQTIVAKDRDTGKFGENGLVYKLSGNGSELFTVNNRTGTITVAFCATFGVAPCLDYETMPEYNLEFIAIDDDGNGESTAVPLKISLSDSNDNPPVFGKSTYKISVNEGASRFDPNNQFIDAKDKDKTSHVVYSIIAGNDEELIKIDPGTGKLKITSNRGLDVSNETDSVISLTVLATDGKYTTTALVNITVLDINNNAPIFIKESYLEAIPEDIPLESSILQLEAMDADRGINAEISYMFSKGDNGDFAIDNNTGIVTVISKLDFDSRNLYNMEVIAVDHGETPLTGTASLTIKIINVNDKSPNFVPTTQKAEVLENAPIGATIYTLIAFDPDVNSSNALNYEIIEPITALDKHGNEVLHNEEFKHFFSVEKVSGKVLVANPLQRDLAAVIQISVRVTDITASNEQQGLGLLVVTIQDINDSPPNFVPPWTVDHPEYHLEIKEELPIGTIVATYKAFDEDSDIVGYAIHPESEFFQINPGTGIVQIQKVIDYEQTKTLNFTVWTYDSGIPQLNVSALVHVKVINLNDHDPTFTQNFYNISIDENSANGTVLLQVKAVDKDAGDFGEVVYELIGEHSENFKIDSKTGEITIVNSKFLDHEKITECVLQVVAHDKAPENIRRSMSVPIYIKINDLNDNAPKFDAESYEVSVMEDVRQNPPVPLIQLNATDLDSGYNGDVHYSIISGNDNKIFLIGMDTGILYAHKSLLGQTKTFHLTVEARDGAGNGDLFDTTSLKVHVINVNDHKPVFVMPYLSNSTVDVLENAATKGLIVLIVKAEDKDKGENGRLTYHFKDDDNQRLTQETEDFLIDENNGELKLKRNLDREEQSRFELTLVARDHGSPKWYQEERHLSVLLVDENDNRPEFPGSLAANPYHFYITENNEPDTFLGHVQALDRDEGQHAAIYYYILNGNDNNSLKLNKATGNLYAVKSLDRETQSEYNLIIVANNDPDYYVNDEEIMEMEKRGETEDKSIAHVVLTINDLNDNEPYFKNSIYYAAVNAMANVNQFVVNVTAFDPDYGINGTLTYYVKGSNLYKYKSKKSSGSILPSPFNVSQRGEVYTATYLAENNQHRFVVDVIARENGFPQREASTQIHVWIFEPEQLIRVILSRPKEEVYKEKNEIIIELSNATQFLIIIDEIRFHVGNGGRKNEDWTDMYILAVDPTTNTIVSVPEVLKIIDSEYDFLKDYYAGFAIENVVPAFIQDREESFDPALAALIALMIVLFVGIISIIIVCCCLKHWVISPTDDLKKKDALIKKAIIDDLTTTENPLWIEQKLKLYEEQELTMQVFNEPELGMSNRRSSHEDVPEDNTYATIQHPHRRQQSNLASIATTTGADDLGEYATLSRIANQPPGSNNSSLRNAPDYYEAAMGFQGSTFQVPDRLSDENDDGSEYGSLNNDDGHSTNNKIAQREFVTELI